MLTGKSAGVCRLAALRLSLLWGALGQEKILKLAGSLEVLPRGAANNDLGADSRLGWKQEINLGGRQGSPPPGKIQGGKAAEPIKQS